MSTINPYYFASFFFNLTQIIITGKEILKEVHMLYHISFSKFSAK